MRMLTCIYALQLLAGTSALPLLRLRDTSKLLFLPLFLRGASVLPPLLLLLRVLRRMLLLHEASKRQLLPPLRRLQLLPGASRYPRSPLPAAIALRTTTNREGVRVDETTATNVSSFNALVLRWAYEVRTISSISECVMLGRMKLVRCSTS